MPKVQPHHLMDTRYNGRTRHRCVTDAGRAIRDTALQIYRDLAQPNVTEHDNGYVHLYWFTPRHLTGRRPTLMLNAVFPPGSAPDSKATVTRRHVGPTPETISELGQLTLEEMRPLVLEHTGRWKANDWQPTGFRKQDGPYLITITADDSTPESGYTVWRVYRHNRIVTEGKCYGWQQTMHIAEKARNQIARREKHNHANNSRYLAALRARPIHYPDETNPDGKSTTLCGQPIGKTRPSIHGRRGADAKASDANVCAACAEIKHNTAPA